MKEENITNELDKIFKPQTLKNVFDNTKINLNDINFINNNNNNNNKNIIDPFCPFTTNIPTKKIKPIKKIPILKRQNRKLNLYKMKSTEPIQSDEVCT